MSTRRTKVYVFRHGETDWNHAMRWQGHSDIPLNEKGRRQARDIIPLLKGLPISRILSSDLARASETARIVAEAIGRPLILHSGFRELAFGEAEGLTFEEIGARFGAQSQVRIRSTDDSDLDFRLPGGESKRELIARAKAALALILNQTHAESFSEEKSEPVTALATHGGFIRTFLQLSGLKDRAQVTIPNGALFLFEYDHDGGELVFIRKAGTSE